MEGRTGAAEGDIAALAHNSSLALQQLAASAVKSGAKLDSLTEQIDSLEGRLGSGEQTVSHEQSSDLLLSSPSVLSRNIHGEQGGEQGEQGVMNVRPRPRRSSSIPVPISPQRTSSRRSTLSSPISTNTNTDTSEGVLNPAVMMVYGDVTSGGNINPSSTSRVVPGEGQRVVVLDAQTANRNEADDEEDEDEEEEQEQRRYAEVMQTSGRRGIESTRMGTSSETTSVSDENHAPTLPHTTDVYTMTSSPSSVGTPRRRSSRRFRSRSRDPLSPLHGNTSYHTREPLLDDDEEEVEEEEEGDIGDSEHGSDSGSSVTQIHQDMDDMLDAPLRPNADDANDQNNQGLGRVTFTLADVAGPDSIRIASPQLSTVIARDHHLYHQDDDDDDDDVCSDLNGSEHDDKGLSQRLNPPSVTTKSKPTRGSNKDAHAANKGGLGKLPSSHNQPPTQPVHLSQKENDDMLSYFDTTRRKRYVYERYVGRTFTDTRVPGEEKGRAQQHQPFRSCVINGIVRLEGHTHLFFVYYDLQLNPRGPPPRSDPRYDVGIDD